MSLRRDIVYLLLGLALFMAGMILGSMIQEIFGIITILGGLLMGFSQIGELDNFNERNKREKVLFYFSFIFLFTIMTAGYLIMIHFVV